jgi:hypothetical protein
MKQIKVYCGKTYQSKCGQQLHPLEEVLNAKKLVESEVDEVAYSNSYEFISAVKYIGKKNNVQTLFFLDGMCYHDDIEPIFKDLNRALDLINEFGECDEL